MSRDFGNYTRDCASNLAHFWTFSKLCLKLLTQNIDCFIIKAIKETLSTKP